MKNVLQKLRIWPIVKITILLIGLTPSGVIAQSVYKLSTDKINEIRVLGTSNVHDFTLTGTGIESQGGFKLNAKNELTGLTDFSFSILAKSLKSGKSLMDTRTYKAINASKYSTITFLLKSAVVNHQSGSKYQLLATGNLSIAGVTQLITLDISVIVNADQSINCTGVAQLKLTDYHIDPPSFMLGAMKVGNQLTIEYALTYQPSNTK